MWNTFLQSDGVCESDDWMAAAQAWYAAGLPPATVSAAPRQAVTASYATDSLAATQCSARTLDWIESQIHRAERYQQECQLTQELVAELRRRAAGGGLLPGNAHAPRLVPPATASASRPLSPERLREQEHWTKASAILDRDRWDKAHATSSDPNMSTVLPESELDGEEQVAAGETDEDDETLARMVDEAAELSERDEAAAQRRLPARSAKGRLSMLEASHRALRRQFVELQQRAAALEAERATHISALRGAEEDAARGASAHATAEAAVEKLLQERRLSDSMNRLLQSRVRRLEDSHSDFGDAHAGFDEERRSLQVQVRALEGRIRQATNDHSRLQGLSQDLDQALGVIQGHEDTARQRSSERARLSRECSEAQARATALEAALAEARTSGEKANLQALASQLRVAELEQELDNLRTSEHELRKQHEEQSARVSELEQSLARSRTAEADHIRQHNVHQRSIGELEQSLAAAGERRAREAEEYRHQVRLLTDNLDRYRRAHGSQAVAVDAPGTDAGAPWSAMPSLEPVEGLRIGHASPSGPFELAAPYQEVAAPPSATADPGRGTGALLPAAAVGGGGAGGSASTRKDLTLAEELSLAGEGLPPSMPLAPSESEATSVAGCTSARTAFSSNPSDTTAPGELEAHRRPRGPSRGAGATLSPAPRAREPGGSADALAVALASGGQNGSPRPRQSRSGLAYTAPAGFLAAAPPSPAGRAAAGSDAWPRTHERHRLKSAESAGGRAGESPSGSSAATQWGSFSSAGSSGATSSPPMAAAPADKALPTSATGGAASSKQVPLSTSPTTASTREPSLAAGSLAAPGGPPVLGRDEEQRVHRHRHRHEAAQGSSAGDRHPSAPAAAPAAAAATGPLRSPAGGAAGGSSHGAGTHAAEADSVEPPWAPSESEAVSQRSSLAPDPVAGQSRRHGSAASQGSNISAPLAPPSGAMRGATGTRAADAGSVEPPWAPSESEAVSQRSSLAPDPPADRRHGSASSNISAPLAPPSGAGLPGGAPAAQAPGHGGGHAHAAPPAPAASSRHHGHPHAMVAPSESELPSSARPSPRSSATSDLPLAPSDPASPSRPVGTDAASSPARSPGVQSGGSYRQPSMRRAPSETSPPESPEVLYTSEPSSTMEPPAAPRER